MRAACLIAVLSLLQRTPNAAASRPSHAPSSARLEVLSSGHIAVHARLNKKLSCLLVLDTGSPTTLISRRAAEKLGLMDSPSFQGIAWLGIGMAKLQTVQIGGAVAHDLQVAVLDHPVLQILSERTVPLDGIVGFDVFAHYRTTLDYKRGLVTFKPSRYIPRRLNEMEFFIPLTRARRYDPAGLWGLQIEDADGGARITHVSRNGAAGKSGLLARDLLTQIGPWWITSKEDCLEAVSHIPWGGRTAVHLLRGGRFLTIHVSPHRGV